MNDFDTSPTTSATQQTLSHNDIARRAYATYLDTGCQPGQCEQNWRQAETELREMTAQPAVSRVAVALHESSREFAPVIETLTEGSNRTTARRNADRENATAATKRVGRSQS